MTEKQIKIRENNVEINYLQQGDADTTLLFLHGWCINSGYWTEQLAFFAQDYSVYAPDLTGFGKSLAQRNNWTIEEYALDISAFIDELGLKNVVLIGHSMSGEIMLQTALNGSSEIIGLVGIDNFKFIEVEFTPEQMEQMGAFFPLLQNDFKTNAPIYAENMLFHPDTPSSIKERVKADFAGADANVGYGSFMNLMQYAQLVTSKLEELPLKLSLINCDGMPTNTDGLEKHCNSGFEVQYVHGTGHYPMVEKSVEFNRVLESVLAQVGVAAY